MDFYEGVRRALHHLKTVDVQDAEVIWDQLMQLEPSLPLGNLRQDQKLEISSSYQGLLNIVLSSDVLNEYGVSLKRTKCLESIFLRALHIDSFFVITAFIKNSNPSSKLESAITILEKFFVNGSFEEMCKDQCCLSADEVKVKSAWKPIWEQLITLIVSLPNRIHNKNVQKMWPTFELQGFSDVLTRSLLSTIEYVHGQLSASQSVSLEFESILLGRLFAAGYGESIFKAIIPQLIPLQQGYLWQKVVQRLILSIPERHLEPVMTALLTNIPWFGYVELFIGNGGMENNTIKFILTKKFVLMRYFAQPDILFKCIGYYATDSRQTILLLICENLLDIWSKKTSIKHQSERQHFYLSCGIMVCCAFLPTISFGSKKDTLQKYLLDGVQTHIESPSVAIRVQGMVIGQTLTSILDPNGPKLCFEYDENDETKLLKSLSMKPERPDEISSLEPSEIPKKEVIKLDIKLQNTALELDSDDDLEPYDQSNDTTFYKDKQPVYVQDVIDGLADHSRTNYSNMCLSSAHRLIRGQAHYTIDVSEELAKILLHLEDTFSADNYMESRFKAMVAVTVVSPEKVAKYLTQEFHNRNYNIRQRLDILEVLAAASQELSECTEKKISNPNEGKSMISDTSVVKQAHWSQIIQDRINAKTRRFGKERKDLPKAVANKFGKMAGAFFFPLIKDYDCQQNGLDLLGENSFVLGRLIYTLGIICNSAANTLIFRQIAKAMFDFIWTLRYHVDAFVRQALLFSLCMVIANAQPAILDDLQAELYECQLWLKDIVEKDPNKECQMTAGKILNLIYQMLKNE